MRGIATIGRCLGQGSDGEVWFFCPGCNGPHSIKVNSPNTPGANWGYNGNPDSPTFTPSVHVKGVQHMTEEEYVVLMAGGYVEPRPLSCHSFVTDGRIQYLRDCTHHLAGRRWNCQTGMNHGGVGDRLNHPKRWRPRRTEPGRSRSSKHLFEIDVQLR